MVRYHFKDRYQSVTEVLQALESLSDRRYLSQPVIQARPINSKAIAKVESSETVQKSSQVILPEPRKISLKLSPSSPAETEDKAVSSSYSASLASSANLQLTPANIYKPFLKSRLPLVAGIAYIFVIIVTGYFYFVHRQSYLQAQTTLAQVEELKTTKNYNECIQQAEAFPADYVDLQAQAQRLFRECKLAQTEIKLNRAKELADQSRLKDAIALAAEIETDTNTYAQAQQLITQWSEKIFQVANDKYRQGNFKEAIAIATAIPVDSFLHAQAQTAIEQWQEELKKNETYLQAAQKALEERRWQNAIDTAKKVSKTSYWQKQTKPIIQKAQTNTTVSQPAVSQRANQPSSRSISHLSRPVATPSTTPLRESKPLPTQNRSRSTPPYTKLDTISVPPRSQSVPARPRSTPPYTKLDTLRKKQ
jgi:serine/threonine-protein kinase